MIRMSMVPRSSIRAAVILALTGSIGVTISGLSGLRSAHAAPQAIVVNTNSDISVCNTQISLRCAIATANVNTTSPTLITFGFSGTIGLSSVLSINNAGQSLTLRKVG